MSVNSAIGLFGNPDVVPVSLTVLTPTLTFPAGVANNSNGVILNGYVVPAGTWLIAGVITGQITTAGNIIVTADLGIIKNNAQIIYNSFLSSDAFACGVPVSAVFVSDGNDTLTISLGCLVADDSGGAVNLPDTWFVTNNASGETNITLIKVA
jgi:hypothetical protein